MALRNAFENLATDESLKLVHSSQTDGSQKTKVVPASGGGLSVYRNISLGTSGITIKSSPGQIYGWFLFNKSSAVRYVKLYNKASNPTVGLDTPFMTIPLPAGGGANVNFTSGITFTKGIGVGATTGASDGDTGAPAANDVIVNVIYY
ncbi:hypothetical protein HY379_02495 [Candidatus Saccharibacteria bacterium]|nr:hypothetical protein [Candidatus Saccharibacteria bacterium]